MKAVILAGGRGSRLKPLTEKIPKPLVPIIDKPVIVCIIELLRRHGITEIGITLGYLAELIMRELGDGSRYGVKLTYFVEKSPLGTAGSVKSAANFLGEDFIVIAGDSYTDINLTKFLEFHREKSSIFTLAAKAVKDPSGFGVLTVDARGLVTGFEEKPEAFGSNLVNTGIYAVNRAVLEFIPDGEYDFGRQLLPRLIGELHAYVTDDYWSDIGTLTSYYYTNYLVASDLSV